MQNHLFITDPLAKLDLKMDTSLRMAFALTQRGHRCFVGDSAQLSWNPHSSARIQGTELKFTQTVESVQTPDDLTALPLTNFQAIHMRKEPPFDMNYIAATWLLDSVSGTTALFNTPRGLRDLNEKLSILHYPDAIAPALVSCQSDEIFSFIENESNGDAILKPLDLYGGKGILRLNLAEQDEAQIKSILKKETYNGSEYRLIQPFNHAIFDGEVRVFTVGAKPLTWCLKKPPKDHFMANSNFGSTRHPYTPTTDEVKMIQGISLDLLNKGVFVAGYDLIGGKLSEINVTSPRLLSAEEDQSIYFKEFARLTELETQKFVQQKP